ncbi:MAG TPA: hypothetical protein VF588_16340 [Pyrinomonadaceae bacterium]|jgi:hypothetical protein
MFKSSGRRTLVFTVVALAAVTFGAVAYARNHAWGSYHWARTKNPFTLKLGDNLGASWKSFLTTASSDWNAGRTPVQTAVVLGQSNKRCGMVAGTTQVCNGSYGQNGWLGLASINVTGGVHITQGSAKMNDTYFAMARYNNKAEKLHVMCQEVAHTFGLGHQSETGASLNTCMDYYLNTSDTDTKSTKPNAHDFDMLNQIYAHLDSTTTLAATSAASAGQSEVTDDPNSWGALVSQSANGRGSVYERYNSDGSKTITHVYWTEEVGARGASSDHRYDHDDDH